MNLFKSPGLNSAENIPNAQHAQKLDQERAARNSRELGNSLTKLYANFYVDVLMMFTK